VGASSHREAPLISQDPVADLTDLYAFVSPDRPDSLTFVMNAIPFEDPAGGPNFFRFGDDVLYKFNLDTNGDSNRDFEYQFRFTTKVANPNTFLYNTNQVTSINDPDLNVKQVYSVTEVDFRGGGYPKTRTLGQNLPVTPANVGARSTPDYEANLGSAGVRDIGNGIKTFAGPRDDPFFADLGAIFDPLGNATHTALQWPMIGEDVLITGAGPIGCIAAAIAQHAGAKHVVVTDLSDYRLELAKAAGADLCVNSSTTRLKDVQKSLRMVEGFDVGLEMSGAPQAVAEMLENMNHGGRVAMLGLPHGPYAIDWGRVITHMITIKGIYGREMFETWYLMNSMLHSSDVFRERVKSVITHKFAAEDWEEAFATARAGKCGKVILDWS